MKYQVKTVTCSKTGAQFELSSFKYGMTRRYTEETKKSVVSYLQEGGKSKDLYDAMVASGISRHTAYANVQNWKRTDFENPIAYVRNKPKEVHSTRYENSTLSRLKKLLGF